MKKWSTWCIGLAATMISVTGVSGEAGYNMPTKDSDKAVYDPLASSEMDVLADATRMAQFLAGVRGDAVIFTENRAQSIRWSKGLPARWLSDLAGHTERFKGMAQPGEFYVFQLGVFAAKRNLSGIKVEFSDLKGTGGKILANHIRSLNTNGVDKMGQAFVKEVAVAQGMLQALWIGIEVPEEAKGIFRGTVKVRDDRGLAMPVELELAVSGEVLKDHGDKDSWRMSRLRWLDSTLGLNDEEVTKPYLPIVREGMALGILGRKLVLGENGLPKEMVSYFNAENTKILEAPIRDVLAEPFQFVVETESGEVVLKSGKVSFVKEHKGLVSWRCESEGAGIFLTVNGLLEHDGFMDFKCQLSSKAPVKLKDIRLETRVTTGSDAYFMGLGKAGGKAPEIIDWKWNENFQDGFWIGAVNGGFKLQLYGSNWRTPLVNCYYKFRPLLKPDSWGSGGIRAKWSEKGASIAAYSGPRELSADQALNFNLKLTMTPFKVIDTDAHWSLRYSHNNASGGFEDADHNNPKRVKDKDANIMTIHHAKDFNPTINYPYFDTSMPLLKKAVADAHANGVKTKVYYTTRELTNNLPELFALWSLNGEIICASPGMDGIQAKPLTNRNGPHEWLVKHLGDTGYIPAWREVLKGRYKGMLDVSVITTPDSRLENFYCEGLAYLLKETNFDGIYIDDTSLGRKGFQRAHRIFEAAGKALMVDMHSWNHNNQHGGMTPSAYLFMENFPYYDRIWYGEGHNANIPPDEMLVQQSGIPFGLMGEMLDHPNLYKGMVFGMTTRLGWSGNPRGTWQFWDSFGMKGTQMYGFWSSNCPVKTDNPKVFATVFQKQGKALIALGSWSNTVEKVKLSIDWQALGMEKNKSVIRLPTVSGMQGMPCIDSFSPDQLIQVEGNKGWLLTVEQAH